MSLPPLLCFFLALSQSPNKYAMVFRVDLRQNICNKNTNPNAEKAQSKQWCCATAKKNPGGHFVF